MNIIVSGSSGFVGSALVAELESAGHSVARLVRTKPAPAGSIHWDPGAGVLDAAALECCDAVIHLGGENIAHGRWTAAKRERIRSSRVDSTRLLATTLAGLSRKPRAL